MTAPKDGSTNEWPEDENDLTDEQVFQMWEAARPVCIGTAWNASMATTTEPCGIVLYERIWGYGQ